ncbi:hypothetical protein CB1_000389030 [Camelus ferus]|nr:hypothetical protein CB1_000389030 [Camelus ferus]
MQGVMGPKTRKQLPGKGARLLIVRLARLQQSATCFIILWSLVIAAQQHLWPPGAKGQLKGVDTSSKGIWGDQGGHAVCTEHQACGQEQGAEDIKRGKQDLKTGFDPKMTPNEQIQDTLFRCPLFSVSTKDLLED